AQGISRFNISKKKMMEVSLTFPSYKEQKQIGAFFTILDNLITLHQRE
ncbi:MAG: restriction endonuclease subunit S, partial [Clostridiaceae bacterium]|nr:restriction endonuclease subunit S [Clostridiaceae bacterium]